MKFQQLYSSSKANLYVVMANNGDRLLIECGCTWKQLQKKLDYDLSNITGCLCSHGHLDHSKSIKDVMKAGIYVYASGGTFDNSNLDTARPTVELENLSIMNIDPFKVLPFPTIHDAEMPLGFVIYCDNEYLLFATDTKYIRQKFPYPFSIIAIECSYDGDILQEMVDTKKIEESVATRLLDSHQEKSVCLNYIQTFCNLSKCREIHLLHMSSGNIGRKQVAKEFEKELFIKVVTI